MASGQPSFLPRNNYATSARLPDRTGMNTNPAPFGQSIPRRSEQQTQFSQTIPQSHQAPLPSQHGQQIRSQGQTNALLEMSEDQKEEINEAFGLFDLDRDRFLDYHEVKVAFRALGFEISKQEMSHILINNGVPRQPMQNQRPARPQNIADVPPRLRLISQGTFQQLAAQKIYDRDPVEEIYRAYDIFDNTGKGYINIDDIRRVAGDLGETGLEEDELSAMIDEFDLEGAGGVNRESFVEICQGSGGM